MPLPLLIGAGMGIAKLAANKTVRKVFAGAAKGVVGAFKVSKKVAKPAAAIVGTGVAWQAGSNLANRYFGQPAGSKLPELPFGTPGFAGGLPALQGGAPGTPMTMPQTIALNACRVYYRAPKGYVIVRDPMTRQPAMAMRKADARAMHLWRPSPKPPISAGDWRCYQRAKSVEKKLAKIARRAIHKHSQRQRVIAMRSAPTRRASRTEIVNVK